MDRVYGYYVDTGQIEKIIEKSTELTLKSPDHAKAWLLHGLILVRRNDDLAAIEALQKAEALDTNDAMSSFYLGELLISQGRLRDAAEALERALSRKPAKNDALAVLQTLGRVYERFDDKENSAKIWDKMEEMFPDDTGILVRIAETLEEEGKFDEALLRYEKLAQLAKTQNYARVRFTLAAADIKIRLGRKQEAIEDFEKLLEELAGDGWLADSVRDRVERVFVRQADYAGLASYYRKRLAAHPNDLNTVHRLAVALVRLSRTDEAKELLQKTLEKAPSNVKLRLALIDLLVNDRNFDEVERQYAVIDEQDPNNPDHISQWGLAVLENRQRDEETRKDRAAEIWLRLVKARPNDLATLVMVADLMAGKRIDAEAEELYRRAVELAPNDPTYREYLGFFYHRAGRNDKAVTTLQTIAEGERRTAGNLSQLSNILHGLGYIKDSLEAVEEAAKLAPQDFALQLRCCELLSENNWSDEAKRQLAVVQKLVETDDELEQYTRCEISLLGARGELPAAIETLAKQADKSAKDWWRYATYLQAAGRVDEATEAIDQAIAREYPETGVAKPDASLLILKTAANIYAKGYDQQKAAAIYEKLAALDASMRVEHLKKLAYLQRDLGQTDKAIETARLVMATGSGNAANSRFFADMLIAIGRRGDGIEALRRAVRLDPTDTVTLAALAEQLAQAGQIDEALELTWRIYDRTEDLQGKMSVISKLSTYYQMSQQFGRLIERLRQGMTDVNGRREAAYCLAQAYASVGDYFAARNSLEILLTGVDEEKTSDTFLLEQLSKISEMQGDQNAAIRYQEMLCDLSSLAQDNERLLGLYYATGQRDKATAMYTQKVFEQGELIDQINAIDRMLAQEDYRPALTLIERLEPRHPDHWELTYRKVQALYWLKEGDPATIARTLATLDIADDTLSEAAQKAFNQALAQAGMTTAMLQQAGYGANPYGGMPYGYAVRRYGYGASPWQFRGKDGDMYDRNHLMSGEMYDDLSQEKWQDAHFDLLPTLFRELLQFEERGRYYGYGYASPRSGGSGNNEKPLYKPETAGDAKFAAKLWQLKIAFDDDMKQLGLESPYATEASLSETTGRGVSSHDHETDDVEDDAEEIKKAELDFGHFNAKLSELLTALPDDSREIGTLEERLRLEVFLGYWVAMNRYLETVTPLKQHSTPETNARVNALATQLAFVTEDTAWKMNRFSTVLDGVERQVMVEYYESLDMDEHLAKLPWKQETLDETKPELRKRLDSRLAAVRKHIAEENQTPNPIPLDEKIDWLVAVYVRACHDNPKEFSAAVDKYRELLDVLHYLGRAEDMEKVRASLEFAGNVAPRNFYRMAVGDQSIPEFYAWDPCLELMVNLSNEPDTSVVMDVAMERITHWMRKGKEAAVNNIRTGSDDVSNISTIDDDTSNEVLQEWLEGIGGLLTESVWSDDLISEVDDIVESEGLNAVETVTAALSAKSRRGTPVAPNSESSAYDLYQLLNPRDKEEKAEIEKTLTMTREKLADIARYEEILKTLLELRFEILRDIGAAIDEAGRERQPQQTAAAMRASQRRSSLLSNGEYFFQRNADVDRDTIHAILGLNPSSASGAGDDFDLILAIFLQKAITLDVLLSLSRPGEGVEPSELEPRFRKLVDGFIAEKTASDNAWEVKIAKGYAKSCEILLTRHIVEITNDTEEIYTQLQDEYRQAKGNGQALSEERLFALAALAAGKKNYELTVECLDAMKPTAATDIKKRENIFLMMHQQAISNKILRARAEEAVDRLLGYQLTTEELVTVRTLLKRFDRAAEADRIRDRLLVSATDARTQYTLLQELHRGGDPIAEQAVQYALKVFRSPAMVSPQAMQSDNFQRELKSLAINVLKKHGKLEEIIEQIEEQWKASPGSTDIMVSLADIYSRNKRDEDAKRIAVEIGKQVPDDAQKMLEHAQLLRQIGLGDEAIGWTCKALEKSPALLFSDFWEYERTFRNAKQTNRLIELIRDMDAAVIEDNISYLTRQISQWLQADSTRETTVQLLDSLWNNEKASDKQKLAIRASLLNFMAEEINPEYYPYLKEAVFEIIQPTLKNMEDRVNTIIFETIRRRPITTLPFSQVKEGFTHHANALVDTAAKRDVLEQLRTEVLEIVARHEATDRDPQHWETYADTRLLEAFVEMKRDNAARACEILTNIYSGEKRKYGLLGRTIDLARMVSEMPKVDKKLAELILERLEAFRNDPISTFPWDTDLYAKRILVRLYFKSDNPERGKKLLIASLRQCLQAASRCGENNQTKIGDTIYTTHNLAELIPEYVELMKKGGLDFELWLVYQHECASRDWYVNMEQNPHTQYFATRLKEPFENVAEGVSPAMAAAHIEMFFPGAAEPEPENEIAATGDEIPDDAADPLDGMIPESAANLAVHCKAVNTSAQGAIRSAFRFLAEAAFDSEGKSLVSPLISSTLLDALRVLAKEDREKFDRVLETLDRLAAENPTEPTYVVARTFCALAAGDNDEMSKQIARAAEWASRLSEDDANGFTWPTYLGFWIIVREAYSHAEEDGIELIAEPCETLLRMIDRAKAVGYGEDGTPSDGEPQLIPGGAVNALNFEMNRVLPEQHVISQ